MIGGQAGQGSLLRMLNKFASYREVTVRTSANDHDCPSSIKYRSRCTAPHFDCYIDIISSHDVLGHCVRGSEPTVYLRIDIDDIYMAMRA